MIPQRRLLALRTVFYLSLVVTGILPSAGLAQDLPSDFRDFLSKQTGKEILLISMSSDSLQYALIVHRSTGNDKRSFAYPIAHIRRVTYLFGRRPYKRIVVEMF